MNFEVIPSIDLLDGRVVRLRQGNFDDVTVYAEDPVMVAEQWEMEGATRLHVVDLEGSRDGAPVHTDVITRIVAGVDLAVQVAGGARSVETLMRWLDAGAARVVTGTAALTDAAFLDAATATVADRLVVAVDARDREVRVAGWTKGSGLDLIETGRRLADAGVVRLLYTDIGRDGVSTGPNLTRTAELARETGVAVIASGGVRNADDVTATADLAQDGVEGVIVGRALYTGDLKLREAIDIVAEPC